MHPSSPRLVAELAALVVTLVSKDERDRMAKVLHLVISRSAPQYKRLTCGRCVRSLG